MTIKMLPNKSNSGLNILRSAIFCVVLSLTLWSPGTLNINTTFEANTFATSTAFAATAPDTSGGIVPCGRETDNPKTANNETDACTLCHLALIANNFILFIFGIASACALLAFMVASLLYIFAGANPVSKSQGKEAITNIIKGYVVIFCAWLIVDFVLSAWGFIDPLGGEWSVVCLFATLF